MNEIKKEAYFDEQGNARLREITEDSTKEEKEKAVTGLRFNTGKLPLDQIPPAFLFELAKVFQHGEKKYTKNNWLKGMAWTVCIGCIFRHVLAWVLGERNDQESGCHHLAHAAWNCMALFVYETYKLGTDDRYFIPLEEQVEDKIQKENK